MAVMSCYPRLVLLTRYRGCKLSGYLKLNRVCVCLSLSQEKVQLQYSLTFTMGDQEHSESGSLEEFPPPETWGNL